MESAHATSIDTLKKKPVYFYVEADIAPFGSGSAMRQYTNLRAYLDLGFDVRIVQFFNANQKRQRADDVSSFKTEHTRIEYCPPKASRFQRLAFYVGFPRGAVLNLLYPIRPLVVKWVREHEQLIPGAIHHFEYDSLASSVASFNLLNSVWSCHDIFSTRTALLWEMRKEFMDLGMSDRYRRTRMKRLKQSENWLARSNKLILNIAEHEHCEFRNQRKYLNAEFFPMSWPDEAFVPRNREWIADGNLRLLHLGSVDGFVGYDSLRFILEEVFPLIPADSLGSIELLIAGKIGSTKFSEHIQRLANAYPNVRFLGYVENVRQIYGEVDLQVVGGTPATGLRTRIVESFVYGLPVLSTVEAARGIVGLSNEINIMLATDAPAFARGIASLILNSERLPGIAEAARKTYQEVYSREAAAQKLSACLKMHF